MKPTSMCFGGVTVKAGEKYRGYVPLGPSGESIPVTFINGSLPGCTVLISSGIHGSEYVGIRTAMELARELEPEDIRGQLLIFHPVNRAAYDQKLSYINPVVGANLNRLYPGKPDGSLAERVCHYMTEEYLRRVDFLVDLHGGDLHEQTVPYVYAPGIGPEETRKDAMDSARLVDGCCIVLSASTSGFYNYANICGTPAILLERGGAGCWSREEVAACKADVRNLLRQWNLLEGPVKIPGGTIPVLNRMTYAYSPASGSFIPFVSPGQWVKKGQLLAQIQDPFGDILETVSARQDGLILLCWKALSVLEDEPIFIYGC